MGRRSPDLTGQRLLVSGFALATGIASLIFVPSRPDANGSLKSTTRSRHAVNEIVQIYSRRALRPGN